MSEHQVRIALPASAVHQAWCRYVGYPGIDTAGDVLVWEARDGSGLEATFTHEEPDLTLVTVVGAPVPDAGTEASGHGLAEFVEGFVAYIGSAFHELEREAGAAEGSGLSGPDGTAHTPGN